MFNVICLDTPPVHCSIVAVAASSHSKGSASIPQGAKCIFLVATELTCKSNAAEGHSSEYLRTFPGIYEDIHRNVWQHSPECFMTFPRMFGDILLNVLRHFPECLATFPGMFEDIPWNVWRHSPECLSTFPGI